MKLDPYQILTLVGRDGFFVLNNLVRSEKTLDSLAWLCKVGIFGTPVPAGSWTYYELKNYLYRTDAYGELKPDAKASFDNLLAARTSGSSGPDGGS